MVDEPQNPAPTTSEQPPAPAPRGYGGEEKRAVFGRVPRSLTRRLERAVVELREEIEDLTHAAVVAGGQPPPIRREARPVLAIVNCSPRVEAGVALVGFIPVKC
jgi:hypothetical protein